MPVSLIESVDPTSFITDTVAPVAPAPYVPAILAPYQPPVPPPVTSTPVPNVVPPDRLPGLSSSPATAALTGVYVPPDLKNLVDPIRGALPVPGASATAAAKPDPLLLPGPLGAPWWAWVGIIVLLILLLA